MRKILTFSLLLVLLLSGCVRPMVQAPEEKYSKEVITSLEVIPNWREILSSVELSHHRWENTSRKKIISLWKKEERYISEELTPPGYDYVSRSYADVAELYEDVRSAKTRGLKLSSARREVRGLYSFEVEGTGEAIDRMIISVYVFDVKREEVYGSSVIWGTYLFTGQKEEFARYDYRH